MKRKLLVLLTAVGMLLMANAVTFAAPIPKGSTNAATANAPEGIDAEFEINVVFVGYGEDDIDLDAFGAELPSTYNPHVRQPALYYGIELPIHISGDYSYNYVFADENFNDDFFSYVTSIGTEGEMTDYQAMYNEQVHKTLSVTNPVLYIDAPSTEYWLMTNGRALGLDVANYTIFYVNWYGRDDFRFHVYTKTDQADPDTGYNFGIIRPTRKMIAWGGSHGRTWFYDLSAGPEAWTDNWNVDDPDIDGGGDVDYRMPPVWEYGNLSGYRPFDDLSGDLGKVARYVAIDLLFTTNPLYDPLASEPFPGRGKRMIVNMFEDDPGSNGLDWIKSKYIRKTMTKFQPQYKWRVKIKDQPLTGGALEAFQIWSGQDDSDDCWNQYGDTFAELFCYFDENRAEYLPPIRPGRNYVGGVYAFNTSAANLGPYDGLLGYADDDWVSGTPSYVFEFDTAEYRDVGYGFSTTTTHEFGHHVGMSHPHDGYDSESDVDYEPTGDFYFAWSGDESHTVMSYIDLSMEFGWFDRDNMNRFLVGRYIQRSAEITAQIGRTAPNADANALLASAEADLNSALNAYAAKDYAGAAAQAKLGFGRVYRAAQAAGLNVPIVEPLPAGTPTGHPKMVDPIRRR